VIYGSPVALLIVYENLVRNVH